MRVLCQRERHERVKQGVDVAGDWPDAAMVGPVVPFADFDDAPRRAEWVKYLIKERDSLLRRVDQHWITSYGLTSGNAVTGVWCLPTAGVAEQDARDLLCLVA